MYRFFAIAEFSNSDNRLCRSYRGYRPTIVAATSTSSGAMGNSNLTISSITLTIVITTLNTPRNIRHFVTPVSAHTTKEPHRAPNHMRNSLANCSADFGSKVDRACTRDAPAGAGATPTENSPTPAHHALLFVP
jgi:hypothetical protein